MKKATLIIGANGAGKTSFYNFKLKPELDKKGTAYINADNIQKELEAEGLNKDEAIRKSGQVAISKMFDCIKQNKDFAFETVFTDKGAMGSIAIAQELKRNGYNLEGHFLHTGDVDINIKNVRNRASKNLGHFVPEDIIRERYQKSLENVKEYGKLFNELNYYDNSSYSFKKVAVTYEKNLKSIEKLYNKKGKNMAFVELTKEQNPKLRVKANNALMYKSTDGTLKERKVETALTEIASEAGKVAGMKKGTVMMSMQLKDKWENYFVNKDDNNNIILKKADSPADKSNFIYFNAQAKEGGNGYYHKMNTKTEAGKRIIDEIEVSTSTKNDIESKYVKANIRFSNEKLKEALLSKGEGHTAIISKTGAKIVTNEELSKKKAFKPKSREIDKAQEIQRGR